MKFREALLSGFYTLQTARDNYRLAEKRMNRKLVERFIEVQTILLAPICPHYCDHLWTKVLNKQGSVRVARWPEAGPVDEAILKQNDYLQNSLHTFRLKIGALKDQYFNTEDGFIYVGESFPAWHEKAIEAIAPFYNKEQNDFGDFAEAKRKVVDALKGDGALKKDMQKVMGLVSDMPNRIRAEGEAALSLKWPFDQRALFDGQVEFMREQLGLRSLTVYSSADPGAPDIEGKKSSPVPGSPLFTFAGEKKAKAKKAAPAPKKAAPAAAAKKPATSNKKQK